MADFTDIPTNDQLRRKSLPELAAEFGYRMYRQPGRTWFSGLQIAHLLRTLRRDKYDETGTVRIRLRRHVLVYGPRGDRKSSCASLFLKSIAGCAWDTDAVADRKAQPIVADISKSTSKERLFGGFDPISETIIDPIFSYADYLYLSELNSFLGASLNEKANMATILNAPMDEGRTSVRLMMGSRVTKEGKDAMSKQARATKRLTYSEETGSLAYDTTTFIVACTHEWTGEHLEAMGENGHLDRYDVLLHDPTEEDGRSLADDRGGDYNDPTSTAIQKYLLAKNLQLWKTKFKTVPPPPRAYVQQILRAYNKRLDSIAEETGLRFRQLSSGRDEQNIMQLLTASAVSRLIQSRHLSDTSDVGRLTYEQQDVEFAGMNVHGCLNWLIHSRMRMVAEDATSDGGRERALARDFVRVCIKADWPKRMGKDQPAANPYPMRFQSSRWVEWCAKSRVPEMPERTARRYLQKLGAVGVCTSRGQGHYDWSAKFLLACGATQPLIEPIVEEHVEEAHEADAE